jgi:hypothetical protein
VIKTAPRRGYLFNAAVTVSTPPAPLDEAKQELVQVNDAPRVRGRAVRKYQWHLWGAAAAVLVLMAASPAKDLAGRVLRQFGNLAPTTSPNEFFAAADASRVAEIAKQKLLPLPAFYIAKIAADVPKAARRFVGIWVSDKGWVGSDRQLMVIVTHVGKDGAAAGYVVNGPPQPTSRVQSPAHFVAFKGRVIDESLTFSDGSMEYTAPLSPSGQMPITVKFADGKPGWVLLDPTWTLVETKHSVATMR